MKRKSDAGSNKPGQRLKKAHRLNAWLVFLDESGLLVGPLVRRSWQPRGQTPVLLQRGRRLEKVSAIAALSVSPRPDQVRLYFRLHSNAEIRAQQIIGFLRHLDGELRGPCRLLWDRLNAHRAKRTRQFLEASEHLPPVFLPAYTPELNPVEYAWSYLKMNPLANWPAFKIEDLAAMAHRHARALQTNESLLRSFLRHSPLFCA
jgi:transposase